MQEVNYASSSCTSGYRALGTHCSIGEYFVWVCFVLLFPFSSLICGDQISWKDVQLLDVQTFPEDVLVFHVLKNPEYQVFPMFMNRN